MNRIAIAAVVCALGLALAWTVADADAPLSITLTTPPNCEADFDGRPVTPTLDIEWQVSGGVGPYAVVVDGERGSGPTGVVNIICGVWNDEERYASDVDSGLMTILAQVSDAAGDSATAVAHVYAVRVIRADGARYTSIHELAAGQTYRVHGLLLTIPDEFTASLGDYHSGDCPPGSGECGDHFVLSGAVRGSPTHGISFSIALTRWPAGELKREVWVNSGDESLAAAPIATLNATLDRLVASIGEPRPAPRQAQSVSDATDLRITLFAPAICETYWGPYGGRRQSIEVEWQVDGGTAPYQVQFTQETLEGARGAITLLCGNEGTDRHGVDAQLMTTQAIVTDSTGATASGIVNTYAIAGGRFGNSRLRGGWTHRMEGLLMTIPEGLEFDVSSIGVEQVECSAGTCTHTGCLDSGMPICESSWSMGTLGGAVGVGFGYVTRSMIWRSIDAARISDDPGVTVETVAEVERLLDELAASLGEPPQLPDDGTFNPAPLRITAWANPVGCTGSIWNDGWRRGTAQRRVAGGYWWPLGVGDEAWDEEEHSTVSVRCPTKWGWHSQELEVHEGGPSPASATTTVSHFTPPEAGDGVLTVQSGFWSDTDTYCKPGGSQRVDWSVRGGVGPYHTTLDGAEVETTYYRSEYNNGSGRATVACNDTVGLQPVMLWVWDSSNPAHYAGHLIILSVVEEHPSGQPWPNLD